MVADYLEWVNTTTDPYMTDRNREIVRRRLSSKTLKELGVEFGCTASSVRLILLAVATRWAWSDQTDERRLREKLLDGVDPGEVPLDALRISTRTRNIFVAWDESSVSYPIDCTLGSLLRVQKNHFLRRPNAGIKSWREVEDLQNKWRPYTGTSRRHTFWLGAVGGANDVP